MDVEEPQKLEIHNNNNNNNNGVDFIEMLTLDANEFLQRTRCVCDVKDSFFCRECFNNNNEHSPHSKNEREEVIRNDEEAKKDREKLSEAETKDTPTKNDNNDSGRVIDNDLEAVANQDTSLTCHLLTSDKDSDREDNVLDNDFEAVAHQDTSLTCHLLTGDNVDNVLENDLAASICDLLTGDTVALDPIPPASGSGPGATTSHVVVESIGGAGAASRRAPPAGVSRQHATDGRRVPTQENPPSPAAAATADNSNGLLSWGFENGRLVFIEPPVSVPDASSDHQYNLTSDANSDGASAKLVDYSDFQKEAKEDSFPDGFGDFCEFDVNDFGSTRFKGDEFFGDSDSESSSCECDEDGDEHFIVIRRPNGDGKSATMVNNESTSRSHNPDRDNLKSLLKKRNGRKTGGARRVVFNETKNEFFDADYIILIREDCEPDDDDDDGACTCQQHEMVRLACCEPNCDCRYDVAATSEPTPQSPKFAPPLEFVDAVALSPPEGYKDMELMARGGGARVAPPPPVCRECSATHDEIMEDDGEVSQSDSEMERQQEKEKTDQSQQTTPTTPPCSDNQNYNIHQPACRAPQFSADTEADDLKQSLPQNQGSPISGILKGGRLWKQQSTEATVKSFDANIASSDSVTSDDESSNKRSVRFSESERACCDGADEQPSRAESPKRETYIGAASPDAAPPETTLTFKLGNHVLISNNSLKPNSAVRQLFPCTKSLAEEENNSQQYLVTSESLRAFEEAKRAKLPQIIQSGEGCDDVASVKRAIERNTLRRSLIRYEPRSKKQPYKSDNSLVERIKQLTCDVDVSAADKTDQIQSTLESEDVLDSRSSPPGEEARNSPDANSLSAQKAPDKSFSPSSSISTTSSSSMSANQNNYHQVRKLSGATEHQALTADMKRAETVPDIQNNFRREMKPLPDIGGPHNHDLSDPPRAVAMANAEFGHCPVVNKLSNVSGESRRQFLAPLTACVTMGVAHTDDYYYQLSHHYHHDHPGDRISVASSGTEYSLDDIDDGLRNEEDKRIAPDVLVGTPSASESGDELAAFVQQDAGRIERIKKKYQPAVEHNNKKCDDEDDEHDDYGFNRRPSVRGIKPRFSTTTEILQQIQNQLQPPAPPAARVAWQPYYSDSDKPQQPTNQSLTSTGNYAYVTVSDNDAKTRGYAQYRPTSLQQEESLYQNCANQRCAVYQRPNSNVYSSVIRMGNDYYQSLPVNRQRHDRPHSPPPMDMSKQYHQTMVYIPYNHIDGYQPVQYDYVARVSSQNQLNKRYVEPVYQARVAPPHEHHYNAVPPVPPKALGRLPYNGQQQVMGGSRSESPLPGQFSTARSTQTPAATTGTCAYYPASRYRQQAYQPSNNRHSFPRYPPADSVSLTDSDTGSLQNGYRQSDLALYASKESSMPTSPTKPRFIERGVPEGAASVSPQDNNMSGQSSSSTMTSPTSPQNPVVTNQKAMFYAMNV